MSYYIHYNRPNRYWCIHSDSCRYSLNRTGNAPHNWWSDEYSDLSAARKAAVAQDSSFYRNMRIHKCCLDGAQVP